MEIFCFRFLGLEVLLFIVLLVASAQEWHLKLQSLKQDNAAGFHGVCGTSLMDQPKVLGPGFQTGM